MTLGISFLALLAAPGLSKEFSTFDYGDESTPVSFGNFDAQHEVRAPAGLMNLYSTATVSGGADVVGRIGATYALNAGDLLSPFTAFTTTSGTAVGELACINLNPGTEASLALALQKWHEVDGNWIVEQTAFVDEWRCPLVTLVNYEPFNGGGTFTYEPGETYRIIVEALARSRANNGSQAITDFCDANALNCGSVNIPGHLIIDRIQIPNQTPVALFHDQTVWYVDAVVNGGVVVTARGCDVDGSVQSVLIKVFLTETATPATGVCANGQHVFNPPAPAIYAGTVFVTDDENVTGGDVGVVQVTLLPPLASAPAGFPDLAAFSPRSTALVETWMDGRGGIEAHRLVVDGIVRSDTRTGHETVDHAASVYYDLTSGQASVVVDGHTTWAGAVAPALPGHAWWDVQPVATPVLG